MSDTHHLEMRRRTALGLAVPAALSVTMAVAAPEAAASVGPAPRIGPEGDDFEVSAALSHHGQVELNWPEQPVESGVVAFTVHRGQPGTTWLPGEDNVLATVGAYYTMQVPLSLSYADFSVVADTAYEYLVLARDTDGDVLARSAPVRITTGSIDHDQVATVLYAYSREDQSTEVRWKLPTGDGSETVRLYSHPRPITNERQWHLVGTFDARAGEATLERGMATRSRYLRLVSTAGTEMTAERMVPKAQHLMVTTKRLRTIREQIELPGSTLALTYEAMVSDIEDPARWIYPGADDPRKESGRASYAALAHLISGEQRFADLAYQQFMVTAERINVDAPSQPLFAGAFSTELALTYDWAHGSWTPDQRAQARTVLLRLAAWWTTTHYINDLPVKSSNWVGITRGGEAILRLALLGEPGYVDDTARFARVVDELTRHVDTYGSSGYTQEGVAYFIYGMREVVPAVAALDSSGIDSVKSALDRHEWVSFIGHAQSFGEQGYRVFMGVDSGKSSSHQYAGEFAAEGLVLARDSERGAMRWLYDHICGEDSLLQTYGNSLGRDLTLLFYPVETAPVDPDESAAAMALLDAEAGAFLFRNRYQDVDDVLVGTFNRNTLHPGWSAQETFGLSLISHDTQWTVMPGKAANMQRISKPLIDGAPESAVGHGRTLATQAYAGQGGGYVALDASGNYQVDVAGRAMVVDTSSRGNVATTIAIHDSFADAAEHTWTWQLAGVRPAAGPVEDGLFTFAFRKNGAWLKGWVIAEDGANQATDTRVAQVETTGRAAEFRVLLAMGEGEEPSASLDGTTITLEGVAYDLDDLSAFRP